MIARFIAPLFLFCVAVIALGIWGCGGRSTRAGTAETGSGIDIAATVTLPSSASGSVSALTTKSATTEVPASDLTVEVYDENDLLLGEGTTGSDGTVTIPDVELAEGAHTLFIRTVANGTERVGALLEVIVTADTTTITKTVNSTEDLAYRSFLAACEKQAGVACAPGVNMSSGIGKVAPGCIRDAILDMASNTVSGDSVGGMFGALLQAHQSNMAAGTAVDMVAVMRGDATAQSTFGSAAGDIASLTTKSAVASVDAAAIAGTILDQMTTALCNDPAAYATIRADTNYQSDPGVFANLFASIETGDITSVNTTELKRLVVNMPAVGFAYSANPLGARAVMETMFSGGFEGITDPTEMQKRYATIVGAGVPADEATARNIGVAARNIYAGTNFANATVENAMSYFGPIFLGDAEQRKDCIVGGAKAFDNLIDRFGSLTAFANQYTASGNVDTFLAAYPQKGVGGSCTVLYDCGVPLSCRAGKCAGVSNLGIACTTSAQCDTLNGAACEPELKMCVNAVGQGVDLAFVGYTPPKDGAAGGFCTTDAACPSDYKCLNGRCEPPGTGAGSEICGDGRCNGAENYTNCTADCGAVSATYCGDGSCQTARLETTTTCPSDCVVTTAPALTVNGGSCSVGSTCSSGYCSSGTCQTTPPTPVTLASNLTGASSLKCNTTECFWIENRASTTEGKVCKSSVLGGTANCFITGQHKPNNIVLAGLNIYLSNAPTLSADSLLIKRPMDGSGSNVTVQSGLTSANLGAVDGSNLYWGNGVAAPNGKIESLSLLSVCPGFMCANASTVVSGLNFSQTPTLQGSNLYFWTAINDSNDMRGINCVTTSGSACWGGAVAVATASAGLRSLFADATNLCWTEMTQGQNNAAVKCMPVGGGSVTTLTSGLGSVNALAVSGGSVFFGGQLDQTQRGILKIATSATNGTPTVYTTSSGSGNIFELQIVGSTIYYLESADQQGTTMTLKKIAIQ